MGFVDDIKAERKEIRARAENIRDAVLERAVESIELDAGREGLRPTVAALTQGGHQLEHFFPVWTSDSEKREIFEHLNELLEDNDCAASVCVVHGRFTSDSEADPDEIRNAPDALPAIICVTHTLGWQEMRVIPYKVESDDIRWFDPVVDTAFTSNLITVPRSS